MKQPRLKPYHQNGRTEAGCDEAGRGSLAGPVFAAAVILPPDFHHPVAKVSAKEIDKMNIFRASIIGMHRALDGLNIVPEFILVDGNNFIPYNKIPYQCVVKGDAIYASIAAASVLAKTHRDEYMCELAHEYPVYEWDSNMGYGTETHRAAIAAHGISPYHRKSFRLTDDQLKLF